MEIKHSVLATSLAAALSLGVAGHASASVYARSALEIDNLVLAITGAPFVTTFNFGMTNTADLNGSPVISTASCANATCTGNPVLNATVVNAPGSTVLQGENTFTIHGPGTQQYANADSVIYSAQLSPGAVPAPTHTQNIAEAELQTGTSAKATSTIDSTTGFVFSFSTTSPGSLNVGFTAILNMLAAITAPDPVPGGTASAQTRINTSLKLANDDTGEYVLFTPNGAAPGECIVVGGGFTCGPSSEAFSLNTSFGVSSLNSSGTSTSGNFAFAANILGAGNYTATYSESKSVILTRTVPEPGVMALLGIGLLGMGWSSRRKFNA